MTFTRYCKAETISKKHSHIHSDCQNLNTAMVAAHMLSVRGWDICLEQATDSSKAIMAIAGFSLFISLD